MKTYIIKLNGGTVNIRVYFLGFSMVTDANGDTWIDDLRKDLFQYSQAEYWFLSFRVVGNLWWINRHQRKRIKDIQPTHFSGTWGLVRIPKWELNHLWHCQSNSRFELEALAEQCFNNIIDGLKSVPGSTVKKAAVVAFLEKRKKGFSKVLVDDIENNR